MNTTLKAKRVTSKDLVGGEIEFISNFINSKEDQTTEDVITISRYSLPSCKVASSASPASSSRPVEVGDILLVDADLRCYVLDKKDQMALLPHNDAKMMSIDYIGRSVRHLLEKGFDQKMVIEVASLLNCFTDCFKAEEHMRKLMSIVQHNVHQVAVEYITSVWAQMSKSTSMRRNPVVAPNILAPRNAMA